MSSEVTLKRANFLLMAAAAFVLLYSIADFIRLTHTFWGAGWDFMMTCDASQAFLSGKNPYLPDSYLFSKNYYTYPPVLLPFSALVCKALSISDLHHVGIYFPTYWCLALLALYQAIRIAGKKELSPMFYLTNMASLGGLLWVMRTGNYAFYEFIFLLISLAYLSRSLSSEAKKYDAFLFAVLFGLFCCIKSISLIFVPLFILFLSFSLKRRLLLMVISSAVGILPFLISYVFFHDEQILQMKTVIVDQAMCNPSMYCMIKEQFNNSGLDYSIIKIRAILGVGILASGSFICLYFSGFFKNIKQWGCEKTFQAFLLGVFFGELFLPRLKEYTFSMFAVLLAYYLLSRNKLDKIAISSITISAVPLIVGHPILAGDNIFGGHVQLIFAAITLVIMLSDFIYGQDSSQKK